MTGLVLVASISGQRVAFPASAIESVVEVETVTPVPGAAPHVAGLTSLRSRVLTVIDCAAASAPGSRIERPRDALVAVLDGHGYALLVDVVEDVAEADAAPEALPSRRDDALSRMAGAYVPVGDSLLLLADVEALVAGPAVDRPLTDCLPDGNSFTAPPEERERP